MAAKYEVLTIRELLGRGDTGTPEKFYRHTIKTKGGVVLTVDISAENFIADRAAPILERKATEADAVLNL